MLAKKICLVIYKLTRSAVRLTKNGTSLSIEHITEIASLSGDRWGADKYKQAVSKPLGAQFVYLSTFCAKSLYIYIYKARRGIGKMLVNITSCQSGSYCELYNMR